MEFNLIKKTLVALASWLLCNHAIAATYLLPQDGGRLVGEIETVITTPDDTIAKLARRYEVGFNALLAANPGVEAQNLPVDTVLTIPTLHILPQTPYEGIVINLPEMRIYYYPPPATGEPGVVSTYPIGIGREGLDLPPLVARISQKIYHPTWHVPQSIIDNYAKKGLVMPESVPPGPRNPLGDYAMRLNGGSYLIHGTNRPASVGTRISHGCIRMYPEDIKMLFQLVQTGTPVRVVNQPYKVDLRSDELYLEVHPELGEQNLQGRISERDLLFHLENTGLGIDSATEATIKRINREKTGVPQRVHTTDPSLWGEPYRSEN